MHKMSLTDILKRSLVAGSLLVAPVYAIYSFAVNTNPKQDSIKILSKSELLSKAEEAYQQDRYEEAVKYYSSAIEKSNIKDPQVYLKLGFSFIQINEYDESISNYQKAAQCGATKSTISSQYDKMNGEAKQIYNEIFEKFMSKKNTEEYFDLIKRLDKAFKISNCSLIKYLQGDISAENGDYTSAIEFLKQSLKIDPADAISYAKLANIFEKNRKCNEVIIYNEIALMLDPHNKYKDKKLKSIKNCKSLLGQN